jgi:hypothetical protein
VIAGEFDKIVNLATLRHCPLSRTTMARERQTHVATALCLRRVPA